MSNNMIDKESDQAAYFDKNAFRSVFQSGLFNNFINAQKGFTSHVFTVREDKQIRAQCLVTIQKESGWKARFSKRAIIYGGPLFLDDKDAAKKLLREISVQLKDVIYLETRNLFDYSGYKDVFESEGWQYEPYLNYHLDCSTQQIAWDNFNTNRKRQIKKAQKLGVVTESAKNEVDVKGFYGVLNDLYKNKIKKPLLPQEVFINFLSSGLGEILLVKFQGKIIGGIVCPILPNDTIYEWYICGLDQEYKDCSPSVMATFAAIEYGYTHGLKKFDFMGAGKPDEDYGVRDFKEKFGGQLVEHGRFIKINNPLLYNLGKLALKILKTIKN